MKNSWLPLIRQRRHWLLFIAVAVSCGCANTRIELNSDFPAPLVTASPMRVAIVLSPELTNYVHSESVARRGEYIINVGMVQKQLFQRLAQGTFRSRMKLVFVVGINRYCLIVALPRGHGQPEMLGQSPAELGSIGVGPS